MAQARAQVESRKKEDALGLSLEPLRQALATKVPGRERDWAYAVEEALTHVEAALREHRAAAKAPDGVLAEVDETRPTLARQADELRGDHDDLLKGVITLRQEARKAAAAFDPSADRPAQRTETGVMNFADIRQRAELLLAGLHKNKHAETDLIQESINTEIGTGD
jgi:hypothetical protein